MDVARIAAMVMVLVAHTTVYEIDPGIFPVRNILANIGVDIFFVLSGYLYGKSFWNSTETFSVKRFHINRMLRILPVYYVVILFTKLISGNEIRLLCFTLLQNFWEEPLNFMPTAWSLCVEEWFYILLSIVFCVMLYFLNRRNGKKTEKPQEVKRAEQEQKENEKKANGSKREADADSKRGKSMVLAVFFLMLAGILIRSICVIANPTLDFDSGIRKQTFLRMDTFAYGIFAAYLELRYNKTYKKIMRSPFPFLIATGLVLSGSFVIYKFVYGANSIVAKIGLFTVLPIGLLYFVLRFKDSAILNHPKVAAVSPITGFLSKLTYPLYLVHFQFYIYFSNYCRYQGIVIRTEYIAKAIVYSILLALVIHFLIELPVEVLRKKLKK